MNTDLVQAPITFDPAVLMPPQWRHEAQNGQSRIYNPAITQYRGRIFMAYRIDLGWGKEFQRRIGICELNEELSVIPDSVNDLSASIQGGGLHHYDPRFLVYRDRLFVHYNNNRQTRPNRIFLVEVDGETLTAKAPARLLDLEGPRQEIEKNWMLFEHDGDLFAVYSIAPHTILQLDLTGQGSVRCQRRFETDWDVSAYTDRYGPPCGGAPPRQQGDQYLSFFHSRVQVGALRHLLPFWPKDLLAKLSRYPAAILRRLYRQIDQRYYYGGIYTFAAAPPFAPIAIGAAPLLRPEWERPRSGRPRANRTARAVVYPCGAIDEDLENWLVSYGLHDELCCLRRFSPQEMIL